MICLAHFAKDKEEIIQLWQECFDDDREYIEFFLNNCPDENALYLYKKNGVTAGMMYLISGELCWKCGNALRQEKAYYLYAVGVSERFRRQGIAGELLEFAKKYARERNAELCLVPADEKLRNYYAQRGFATAFYRNDEVLWNAVGKKQGSLLTKEAALADGADEISRHVHEIYVKRKELFGGRGSFLWSEANLWFALEENLKSGGFLYFCNDNNAFEYAVGICENDSFYVKEASFAANSDEEAASQPYAMITDMLFGAEFIEFTAQKDRYINLCLD